MTTLTRPFKQRQIHRCCPKLSLTTRAEFPLRLRLRPPQPRARTAKGTLSWLAARTEKCSASRISKMGCASQAKSSWPNIRPAKGHCPPIPRTLPKKFTSVWICSRFGRNCSSPKTKRSSSAPSKSSPRCATKARRRSKKNARRLLSILTAPSPDARRREQPNECSHDHGPVFLSKTYGRDLSRLRAQGNRRCWLRLGLPGGVAHPRNRRQNRHAGLRGNVASRQPIFKDLSIGERQQTLSALPAATALSR